MQSNANYGYIQQPPPTPTSHYAQSQPQMANTGHVRPNFGYMATQPMPSVNYPYQIVNPQAIMSQPQQAQYQAQAQIPLVPLAQQSPLLAHNLGLNGAYSDNSSHKLGSTYMNSSYPNNGMRKTKEEASSKPNKLISKSYSTRESNNSYIKKETNNSSMNAQKIQRSSSNNQANGSKYNNNNNSSNPTNPSLTVSIQLQQIGVMQSQSLKLHQSASFNANMAQNMPQPMSLNSNSPLMYPAMYGMRPGAQAQAQAQAHPAQLSQMPMQQQQLNQPPPFNPNANKPYLQSYQIP